MSGNAILPGFFDISAFRGVFPAFSADSWHPIIGTKRVYHSDHTATMRTEVTMAKLIGQWIASSLADSTIVELPDYVVESDDDGAIFGDITPVVSGTVVS